MVDDDRGESSDADAAPREADGIAAGWYRQGGDDR